MMTTLDELDFSFYIIKHGIEKLRVLLNLAGCKDTNEYIFQKYIKPELKYILCMKFNFQLLLNKNDINTAINIMEKHFPPLVLSSPDQEWMNDNISHTNTINEKLLKKGVVLYDVLDDLPDYEYYNDFIKHRYINDEGLFIYDKRFLLANLPSKSGLYFHFQGNRYKSNWNKNGKINSSKQSISLSISATLLDFKTLSMLKMLKNIKGL